MALDFPNAPTDGQVYGGFTWDNTAGLWRVRGNALSPAGVSGVTGTVATTTDGNDTIYSFTDDGTITIATGGIANILLVGGGGSGGCFFGGGGGAGGVLYVENIYLPAGALDVVVGDGGAVTPSNGSAGTPGVNGKASSLWKYYVAGGGGGGASSGQVNITNRYWPSGGGSGGSGGGDGGANMINPGASANLGYGTPGLGNNGGQQGYLNGGGGGGAGAVGADGGNTSAGGGSGGDGGDGVQVSITGSAVYYGGGGAGTAYGVGGVGTGGLGGGADGTYQTEAGAAGTDGLGGGGAGGSAEVVEGGGDGGSGIVIVRILG